MTRRLHAGGFLTHLVEIEVGGETIRAIPKDYQLDPVRDFLIHVDFLRVGVGAQLTLDVPVHFINHAEFAWPEARRRFERRAPRGRDDRAGRRHSGVRRGRPYRSRHRRFRPYLRDRVAGRRDADHHRPRLHRRDDRRRRRRLPEAEEGAAAAEGAEGRAARPKASAEGRGRGQGKGEAEGGAEGQGQGLACLAVWS